MQTEATLEAQAFIQNFRIRESDLKKRKMCHSALTQFPYIVVCIEFMN